MQANLRDGSLRGAGVVASASCFRHGVRVVPWSCSWRVYPSFLVVLLEVAGTSGVGDARGEGVNTAKADGPLLSKKPPHGLTG